MATNQNDSARSGKIETLNEVLVQLGYLKPEAQPATQEELLVALLECTQRISVNEFGFMYEAWDWMVALQWMQDNRLFKSNPKRPPFTPFEQWLHDHNVPQIHQRCSTRNLTYTNKKIAGARYPWTDAWELGNALGRWRTMYHLMTKIWRALSQHNEVLRNKASKHD